jgi:TolB-like protein
MSRFLRFIVERTLAGDGERLKEYVIGIEVFDRDTSYDPRVDSIVRVEAARLRSKLAEYYAGDGKDDAVILTLPKGGYAPIVRLEDRPAAVATPAANGTASLAAAPVAANRSRSGRLRWLVGAAIAAAAAALALVAWPPSPSTPSALRIAVLPFTPDAGDADRTALAQRLTEGVTAELVRDGRFSVVASSAARAEYAAARRPRDIGSALDADILIQARVSADGDDVRVETYAVSGEREEKVWVEGFTGTAANPDELEHEVAAAIGAALSAREAHP